MKKRGRYCVAVIIVTTLLFTISCSETVEAPAIEGVSEIVVQDNGNQGDGSDIEVNFKEQIDQGNIESYRIMAIKASQVGSFDLEDAVGLTSERFRSVSPASIFPVKGVTFTANSVDTDGDIVTPDQSYRFGVLTVVADPVLSSNNLTISNDPFQLKINNQVVDHSPEFAAGAGSLAIDAEGSLYMGSYNIIYDLTEETDEQFPIYKFGKDGNPVEYSDPMSLLLGNTLDKDGNLYQSLAFEEAIIVRGQNGDISRVTTENALLSDPDGLFIDQAGQLFVVNSKSGFIVKMREDGTGEIFADVGQNPRGLTGDNEGNLYVSHNNQQGEIMKISPSGQTSTIANIPTFKSETYTLPYFMWVGYLTYHDGALYVAGMSTDRIYKVGLNGGVESFVGSGNRGIARGGVSTANLNRPIGLAFHPDGSSLYISVSTDLTPSHTQATTPVRILEVELVE